ncbi:unnamed protein product [Ambrosiozyma monospora]|uniref:Unnamed protein product n=1 Tax=Ambrosiozyma monospora TaxID=43982 RepID=A0ACB5UDD8_AMBMO|nr:unnamed protein product [Ambrosiozyma monospora]
MKCDMWSLGVLLYVCICGFPPFSEELAPPSMKQQIVTGKFAFYKPYWDDVDELIMDLIVKLLVVNPTHRIDVVTMGFHPWLSQRYIDGYQLD